MAVVNGYKYFTETPAAGTMVVSVEEQAVFVAMTVNSMARSEAEATELIVIVGRVRTSVLTQVPLDSMITRSEFLKAIDKVAAERAMSSPRWIKGMSFLNILVAGLAAYDMYEKGANWGNASAMGMGVGAAGSVGLKVLLKDPKFLGFSAAESLGRVVAVAGFAYGVYQTVSSYQDRDKTGVVLNGLSTLGSVLILASLAAMPFAPVLAVVGGILVVSTGIISVLREVLKSEPTRWWEGIQGAFEEGTIAKAISARCPA